MIVNSAIFGEQSIDPSTAIIFPKGIPGFEACKRFKLFHQESDEPLVYWLQSLDDGGVTFSVAEPTVFGINFDFTVTDEEIELLGGGVAEDLLVLILLYKDPSAAGSGVKGSVKAPLIINIKTMTGLQKVLEDVEPSVTLRNRSSVVEFKAR